MRRNAIGGNRGDDDFEVSNSDNIFLTVRCRNCGSSRKTYALSVNIVEPGTKVEVLKYGEQPEFGPQTPARLISLIGPDKELFHKGRRAENQGLGIGAFGYYRRIVENQKNRIIDEIIRAAKKLPGTDVLIADLDRAKQETQFSTAVAQIKHGIPQVLLIDGHNPLNLLHSALSEGLHTGTEERCLELATSIRVVMAELAERLSVVLKEHVELKDAVSKLMKTKGSLSTERN